MTYLNCPHCNLAIQVGAAHLAPRSCPRCVARRRVTELMYETARPARLAAEPTSEGRAPESR